MSGLQIRLDKPARGQLRLMQGERLLAAAAADSRPERRLSLPLPAIIGPEPLTLTIEETP